MHRHTEEQHETGRGGRHSNEREAAARSVLDMLLDSDRRRVGRNRGQQIDNQQEKGYHL